MKITYNNPGQFELYSLVCVIHYKCTHVAWRNEWNECEIPLNQSLMLYENILNQNENSVRIYYWNDWKKNNNPKKHKGVYISITLETIFNKLHLIKNGWNQFRFVVSIPSDDSITHYTHIPYKTFEVLEKQIYAQTWSKTCYSIISHFPSYGMWRLVLFCCVYG